MSLQKKEDECEKSVPAKFSKDDREDHGVVRISFTVIKPAPGFEHPKGFSEPTIVTVGRSFGRSKCSGR